MLYWHGININEPKLMKEKPSQSLLRKNLYKHGKVSKVIIVIIVSCKKC